MQYRLRLGASVSFCSKIFYDRLAQAAELGFDAIDFDISGCWSYPDEEKVYYERLESGIEAVARTGIPVNGIHISFGDNWDISVLDEPTRRKTVADIASVMKRTASASPYCYIFHGSFEPVPPADRQAAIDALKRSVRELSDFTDRYLCIETLPRTCLLNTSEEANAIIDSLALPNVGLCADVNHFLKEKSEDAVLSMGARIKTTHISDHDYVDERHWLPGQGKIDWMKLIGALEAIGYNGVFNYEVGNGMLEIRDNYNELFDRYNKTKGVK